MNQWDDDHMRWAEAVAIERIHRRDAPRWIAERIGSLAAAGDHGGVERFIAIASHYEALLPASDAVDG